MDFTKTFLVFLRTKIWQQSYTKFPQIWCAEKNVQLCWPPGIYGRAKKTKPLWCRRHLVFSLAVPRQCCSACVVCAILQCWSPPRPTIHLQTPSTTHVQAVDKSSLTNFYEISPGYFFETPEDLRDKPYNMKMQVKFVMATARDSFLVCAEAAIPNHFWTITAHSSLHLLLTSEQ